MSPSGTPILMTREKPSEHLTLKTNGAYSSGGLAELALVVGRLPFLGPVHLKYSQYNCSSNSEHNCSPTELYVFAYLESYCLRV